MLVVGSAGGARGQRPSDTRGRRLGDARRAGGGRAACGEAELI
jgi:hypothetical protein